MIRDEQQGQEEECDAEDYVYICACSSFLLKKKKKKKNNNNKKKNKKMQL
jgi:hypothetical protein